MRRDFRAVGAWLLAALCASSALSASGADYPFSKWSEQFSRWKTRSVPGAYDRMVSGGPDGSTLVTFPYAGGLMRSLDGGLTWEVFSIDGQGAAGLAMAPRNFGLWYAYGSADHTLHRTTDSGRTWSTRGQPLASEQQVSGLAVSANPSVVYRTLLEFQLSCENLCPAKSGTLQRSIDDGATWQDIGPSDAFQRAYPSLMDANQVFALGGNGLQRSDDQGATWSAISLPAIPAGSPLGGGLALDRFDPKIAYLVSSTMEPSASVLSTHDGGATWAVTALPGGRMFADGAQTGRAFLFTYFFGTYETRDAGRTWVKLDPTVYTSINSNVAGVVLRGGRRFAVGPYFNTLRELDLNDGALALTSDLWWKPDESGWGLTITHRASTQTFIAWYAYDEAGIPVWRTISGGAWTDRTFSGDVYETAAAQYFGGKFDPSTVSRRKVGVAQITFESEAAAVFSYQLASGSSGSKTIQRFNFGPPVAIPAAQESYADLWWNAAESGWGVAINHQNDNIFAAWFAYDDTGHPLWLTMPDARLIVTNGVAIAAGDVYSAHGPSSTAPFDPAQVALTRVGAATLSFRPENEAVLSSTVFGRSESRVITRLPF